jgi:hypothetical protein
MSLYVRLTDGRAETVRVENGDTVDHARTELINKIGKDRPQWVHLENGHILRVDQIVEIWTDV